MKNIHILPTDKPSRLSILNSGKLNFGAEIMSSSNSKPQHIYITNDETPNKMYEGFYLLGNKVFNTNTTMLQTGCKAIILTTDQDLNGVQAIDDEFLEWFVKNPSCKEVALSMIPKCACGSHGYRYSCKSYAYSNVKGDVCGREVLEIPYKIIIPYEEPNKTHYLDELPNVDKDVLLKMWNAAMPKLEPKQECKDCNNSLEDCTCIEDTIDMKQETLEEVRDLAYYKANAEEDYLAVPISVLRYISQLEQQERSYSDIELFTEELKDKIDSFEYSVNQQSYILDYINKWFEQFKKK